MKKLSHEELRARVNGLSHLVANQRWEGAFESAKFLAEQIKIHWADEIVGLCRSRPNDPSLKKTEP